jgi:hypothetical protein
VITTPGLNLLTPIILITGTVVLVLLAFALDPNLTSKKKISPKGRHTLIGLAALIVVVFSIFIGSI